MTEQSKPEDNQAQLEPIDQDRPLQCGTAILRRGLAAMNEDDRDAIFDILDKGGLTRAI